MSDPTETRQKARDLLRFDREAKFNGDPGYLSQEEIDRLCSISAGNLSPEQTAILDAIINREEAKAIDEDERILADAGNDPVVAASEERRRKAWPFDQEETDDEGQAIAEEIQEREAEFERREVKRKFPRAVTCNVALPGRFTTEPGSCAQLDDCRNIVDQNDRSMPLAIVSWDTPSDDLAREVADIVARYLDAKALAEDQGGCVLVRLEVVGPEESR